MSNASSLVQLRSILTSSRNVNTGKVIASLDDVIQVSTPLGPRTLLRSDNDITAYRVGDIVAIDGNFVNGRLGGPRPLYYL